MGSWVYIGVALAVVAAVVVSGWWRLAFAVFRIPAERMTADRLGLLLASSEDRKRVSGILQSFAGGFNAMIASPSPTAWRTYCDSLSSLNRPFAHEGGAMGYTLRNLFRYDPSAFEEEIVKPGPEFRYLYYVGLGFWSGMRNHNPAKLGRIVQGLDPLHSYLCYDGYGFKHAFFDYRDRPDCFNRFDRLEGYARNVAYQGVGRAFWFLFSGRPEVLIEHTTKLGAYAADAAAGVGLASVFVDPDRLDRARTLGAALPSEWHPHFHLGMCFGLKARSINDREEFERNLENLDPSVRDAVHASIRECDRVELQVRAEGEEDGYRRWRRRVTDWMAGHLDFPLARVKSLAPASVGLPEVSPAGEEMAR